MVEMMKKWVVDMQSVAALEEMQEEEHLDLAF